MRAAGVLGAMGVSSEGGRGFDREELAARARAWAERTCAEQGISLKVSDPQTIARVAELLAQGRQAGVSRESSKRL